jgi:hypothetical protein
MSNDKDWFARYFIFWFLILILLQLLDWGLTVNLVVKNGVDIEGNPFVKYVLGNENGVVFLLFWKLFFTYGLFVLSGWWLNHPKHFYNNLARSVFVAIYPIVAFPHFFAVYILVRLTWG